MRALRWIAALWPGLLLAWLLGSWRGLALASGFAAALNAALVATVVWPRWTLAPAVGAAAWLLVLGLWVYGALCLRREWPKLGPRVKIDPCADEWFCAAQQAYLRGHL